MSLLEEWLVIEWLDNEDKPSKCVLATLPTDMKRRALVDVIKQRWRTERAYQDLKGELGLDHFEGRLFVGWNHHVSVVLASYAFVVPECVRTFSPSRARKNRAHSVRIAA